VEAPELFDMDNEDVAVLLQENPGAELRDKAHRAADACPMAAIAVED
jgi:ferredoxin